LPCQVAQRGLAASIKLRGEASGVFGEPGKLRVRTGTGKDLSVTHGHHSPAFTLKSPGHDSRAAPSGARVHDLVNELNELVG
jgi:hypothetical protein